jgi:hypothetical protein
MTSQRSGLVVFLGGTVYLLAAVFTVFAGVRARTLPLDSLEGLEVHNVTAKVVTYKGRKAIRVLALSPSPSRSVAEEDKLVIVRGTEFQNGVIEVDLAAKPAPGAPPLARGFIGVAFHINKDASKFEYFYLRPTNARADDQLRRNHSAQYAAFSDFPWFRSRKEFPGKYESYVDLVPGEWTHVKIEVHGLKAHLYVNGSGQPCLVVNDLKLGIVKGAVALKIGPGTEGYFSNLKIILSEKPWSQHAQACATCGSHSPVQVPNPPGRSSLAKLHSLKSPSLLHPHRRS